MLHFDAEKARARHRSVRLGGEEVRLTPTEFALLEQFVTNPGKLLTHRLLLQRVWGPEYGDEAEYLRVYVGRLRRKLERDPATPRLFASFTIACTLRSACSLPRRRRKSLPPMHNRSRRGEYSSSTEGRRSSACAVTSPGTPARTTRRPIKPSSCAG